MGRIITETRKNEIAAARAADPEALGPMMGELMVEGNIPVGAVAVLLKVSEPTVYRWMYGHSTPRDTETQSVTRNIKRLNTILRKAKRARQLPLVGTISVRTAGIAYLIEQHKPTRSA